MELCPPLVGIDGNFTRGDKWITGSLFVWSVGWFSVMILGTAWNLLGQSGPIAWIKPWPNDVWLGFWHFTAIGLPIPITIITGLWFTWGGSTTSAPSRSTRSTTPTTAPSKTTSPTEPIVL